MVHCGYSSLTALDLMLRLNHQNQQTFVIVTHDPGVGALADRIVQMKGGRVVSHSDESGPLAASV